MARRRRFNSSLEWERGARYVIKREAKPLSREEQRAALLRIAGYMLIVWGACAAVILAWSLRFSPVFDDRSPGGWVYGITKGSATERAAALLALGQSRMLSRVPCYALADRLRDSAAVREAAVPTLIVALRSGRCVNVVLTTLTAAPQWQARAAAAQILGGVGSRIQALAVAPLIFALQSDSATRPATIAALAALGDTSEQVRNALQHVFNRSRGELRGNALEALAELKLPPVRLDPLARQLLRDPDPAARVLAVDAIELTAVEYGWRSKAVSRLLPALDDSMPEVRSAARDVLARIAPDDPQVMAALGNAKR